MLMCYATGLSQRLACRLPELGDIILSNLLHAVKAMLGTHYERP